MLPILFNTDMVQAILDGRKTVTRRIVKFIEGKNPNWTGYEKDGLVLYNDRSEPCSKKPPYQAGDILYVREAWIVLPYSGEYLYRADCDLSDAFLKTIKWKPSIHMPKEAARIWLKVTDVRVERLRKITPEQADKEGVGNLFLDDIAYSEKDYGCPVDLEYGVAKEQFAWLWDSTIKKPDITRYGWEANPCVWVIEFEQCGKPEGWLA